MLSLNFASRAELARLGLSDSDIEAFVELRTQIGEITAETLASAAFSNEGRALLQGALSNATEVVRTLTELRLSIHPDPPIATMDEMTIAVTHHGVTDRELRTLTTTFLPHGPMLFSVFDISLEHIIKIELISEDKLIVTRIAIPPPSDWSYEIGGSPFAQWSHMPALGTNERWSQDGYGSAIGSQLLLATRTRPEIVPVTPELIEVIHRKGRFIVPGRPDFRFDDYSLSFSFPDTQLFTKLPGLFGDGQAPHVARLEPNDPVVSSIFQLLTAEPGEVDFNGMFEINVSNRPTVEASGWAWILMGSSIYVGFQPDPDLYASRNEIIITLPHGGKEAGEGVPFNITERGMLDRPELFGGDAGLNCRPFDQPGRILGERRFQTALRVTQPFVRGARRETITFEGITKRPIDFPRNPVTSENFIEYEGENASYYQAKTVAIGHLLEMSVRYRSNGYSLGDIAYSLTLAPRQKRRIVKIDYSRTESALRRETTRAEDDVADSVDSSRNYDNVVAAELDERSRGRSQAGTTSAAGGFGFAVPGFVGGGGAATSTSKSSSSQEGGRRTAASERQQINDSIRRRGEALRTLQSTVIQEVEQSETVQGVSEVVQNINYTRSLSVIYYEILRHLRVDTEVAGVTECVYVPMQVSIFTDERIERNKDVLRRYARTHWERLAFDNLGFLPDRLEDSDIPSGIRANQNLSMLTGSIWITIGLEMPGEGEIADEIADATDEVVTQDRLIALRLRALRFFTPYLPIPISQIVARMESGSPTVRNRYFQQEIAPHMVRRFVNDLRILDNDNNDLGADFTLASNYSYGRSMKVDFTVNLQDEDVTRKVIERLTVKFKNKYFEFETDAVDPKQILPARSFMDVTRGIIRYSNDLYEDNASSDRGTRDLINSVNGHAEEGGALLTFRLSHADNRNLQDLIKSAYSNFSGRINARPFFYHKAIWWNMDRDQLYTLLDGFSFEEAGGRSLASMVERRPLGILGNSLVFKVSTNVPLDPMFENFEDLKAHYVIGLPASDPIRVSLPTDGLYARAHMDGCIAAEEHNGSFDWVFDNQEPELADIPSNLLESRRLQTADMTPTRFPETIINLQNAPGMPAPSGLEDAFKAIQNAGAFRDMAGLAGTQANAQAGLNTAAGLATGFGSMAFQGAMAQLQADAKAASDLKGMYSAIEKARDSGLITPEQAGELAMDVTKRRMQGKDENDDQHRRNIEKKAMEGEGGGSINKTDKDGSETIIKNPTQPSKDDSEDKKPTTTSPPVGYVRWLEGERGGQDLLLYNFGIGEDTLHPAHMKALKKISVQISGVGDIAGVEGRASATQTLSDEEEHQNEALSQRRMERVWNELMRYAYDPQSNMDRQLIFSDESPIRDRYALGNIPKGRGDEDPVERSVLIRLDPRVKSDIEPIPVDIPENSGIPQCTIYGHTFEVGIWTLIQNRIVGDQSAGHGGSNIHNTGDNNKFEITKTIDNSTTNNFITLEVTTASVAGNNPTYQTNRKPTNLWKIKITNPDIRGNSPQEVIALVDQVVNALMEVTESFPHISMNGGVELNVPMIGDLNLKVSTGDINPPLTIAKFFSRVSGALADQNNIVGRTLAGLVHGDAQLNVAITAISPSDPDNVNKIVERHGIIAGRGFYFRQDPEVSGNNVQQNVTDFRYETRTSFKLGDWSFNEDLQQISVNFRRVALDEDLVSAFQFLIDLSGLINSQGLRQRVSQSALKVLDTVATHLMNSEEHFSFKPKGQNEKTLDSIGLGATITAFKFDEYGTFNFID